MKEWWQEFKLGRKNFNENKNTFTIKMPLNEAAFCVQSINFLQCSVSSKDYSNLGHTEYI